MIDTKLAPRTSTRDFILMYEATEKYRQTMKNSGYDTPKMARLARFLEIQSGDSCTDSVLNMVSEYFIEY